MWQMPRWTRRRGRGRGRSLNPVRSPLLFLFLFRPLSGLLGGEEGGMRWDVDAGGSGRVSPAGGGFQERERRG
ncbi:hypothetical protein B0H14DRAFT_2997969 [Mycena olivaceomarginata]|nr:hypothetical protein B0H14DRAFT_2997969 [Mycena olivaceomarginata]